MKTAENTMPGEEATSKLSNLLYAAVGIAAITKEKIDELVEEVREQYPETIEKGQQIVNDFVDETKLSATKLGDDIKSAYEELMEQMKEKKENFKSAADTEDPKAEEDEDEDLEEDDLDDDADELDEDEETDFDENGEPIDADDDEDLDDDDDDDMEELEGDEDKPTEQQHGRDVSSQDPVLKGEGYAKPKPTNTPPTGSEMNENDVDGAAIGNHPPNPAL
jgi:hypothetical protein